VVTRVAPSPSALHGHPGLGLTLLAGCVTKRLDWKSFRDAPSSIKAVLLFFFFVSQDLFLPWSNLSLVKYLCEAVFGTKVLEISVGSNKVKEAAPPTILLL